MLLLRQEQVIKEYNISKDSLYKWIKNGLITEYRTPGKHRRYDRIEIENVLHGK